ncbi:MAG: hypothetical protein GBAus27B_000304 [Mycoplasmataceae bacterium]|nr:MAG: hypothetical protein GBAus27B_000304 [Mycoplasmataceae bacterium]
MTLKNKLEQLTTEFTNLKEKILNKLALKNETIQAEKDSKQETVRQLEITIKDNSENEKVLTTLLKEFQELNKQLGND